MSLDSRHPVEARRIGNAVVAAFHKANPPLVWRFDLERNHSFSLALQGAEGDWQLGLTSSEKEFQAIAHFAERTDAERAFTETEKILAQGKSLWATVAMKILGVIALVLVVT